MSILSNSSSAADEPLEVHSITKQNEDLQGIRVFPQTASDRIVPARKADDRTWESLPDTSQGVELERARSHTSAPAPRSKVRLNWLPIFWIGLIHAGVLFAPFTFTWSGLALLLILYVLTSLGVNVGFHRLLTHRSFETPRPVEYFFTALGSLAGQGGVLQWVATHRAHHAHADEEGDPHSPRDGAWWAHMLWWMPFDRVLDVADQRLRYVRDLAKDPVHRFLDHCQVPLTLVLALMLFVLGEAWGGMGLSWVVWGIFVRMTLTYHVTWLVNSATHMWGYRSYATKDRSTNLWWVALLSFGEGWHNNHHAFPRSARHGLRWWELDLTYWTIRLLTFVRLARHVQMPHAPSVNQQENESPASQI